MSDKPAEPAPPADGKVAVPAAAKTSKIVLALLVLNLGASGFATFKLLTASTAEAAPHREPEPPVNEIAGPVVAFDPFVVNLDEPGTSRYLKVTIQVEAVDKTVEEGLEKNKQLVRDAVLSYLSGLHVKDTLGGESKEKIRAALMSKLEGLLGPGKVRRMFFQEFVVQ
jgi:flagellar protein FliL